MAASPAPAGHGSWAAGADSRGRASPSPGAASPGRRARRAAVTATAEDLVHVPAGAAVARCRRHGGGVHECSFAVGRAIAAATASGLKRPPSSIQRSASSRAWARIASRRAKKSSTRSAIRWCLPGGPSSAALSRGLMDRKPMISASSPPGSSRDPQPGHRSPTPPIERAALYRRVLQARHLKWGIGGRFRSVPQGSIDDNVV
jgi:hypothetical protein